MVTTNYKRTPRVYTHHHTCGPLSMTIYGKKLETKATLDTCLLQKEVRTEKEQKSDCTHTHTTHTVTSLVQL